MTELKRITQFAGESFSTKDNVRVVYVGEGEDTVSRPSRTIVLVGPIGAGKSSLIDFLCNYFYGVSFDSEFRYKIADEIFDNTTPEKAVIKYVFNGTKMPYRPIVIDTPGIGDPTGLKADRELASVLVCLLPSFMHSVNDQIDSDIKLTLSLFPHWMHSNIVPIVTYSDYPTATNNDLLRHFQLDQNATFCVDTNVVFMDRSSDPKEQAKQQNKWQLTADGVRQFLRFVGDLKPQTIERKLLEGDATPNPPVTPSETLGQTFSPDWQKTASEPVHLVEPIHVETLGQPKSGSPFHIPLQETDEQTLIREVTVITERIKSNQASPTHSLGQKLADSSPTAPPLNRVSPSGISLTRIDIPADTRPRVPPHLSNQAGNDQKEEMKPSGAPPLHHRSDSHLFPYADEELTESSNLELLRRYIYDPASRTYKIQYVHEVSTRESRRSSGRQSLRASAADLEHPISDGRRHAPTSGGLDDSFLGTLADELRRQGQYDDRRPNTLGPRNTSAPNLESDYNKENARRYYGDPLDYSPDALKRLLDGPKSGLGQGIAPSGRQPPHTQHQRPVVIRKPYASDPQPPVDYYRSQPLRPSQQSNLPDEYAANALNRARDQRSASHAVEPLAQSPDRSFDDKERLFERSDRARQSFHSGSLRRGGVRHAIATRPDTDYNDDWDEDPTVDSRRPVPEQQQGPVPQPRTINVQPLRHTPGLHEGQKVRPSDLEAGHQAPPQRQPWSTYPIQSDYPKDPETGYRPREEQRPLRTDKKGKAKKEKKGKKAKPSSTDGKAKNRKFPSFTKICFYVIAPMLVILVVGAIIITLIVIG
ncbi:RNA polymerase II-associated factor 1-like protein [Aphelenchoides bicaudatus]|nr:RNA polymerase II-associated factor 1-like protein [Aphelenchoides bicaudatus]